MPVLPGAELLVDERPFELEFGGRLARLEIAYETWGALDADAANAVFLCPAFSAHSHAQSHPGDPSAGWWEGMVGPGLAFDTDRFFVVCASLVGGSYGTTGPLSTDPATGRPYAGSFPVVSVRDIVGVHLRLLDHLGIARLFAAAGGSLGAMEAIELAVRHPRRVRRVVAASGTAQTLPYTAAIRHLGRRAILLDPAYQGGAYEGDGPVAGLMLARELGTLFYRSRRELNQRFAPAPIRPPSREGITFDVQSYLDHQGQKAIGRFDANSYLTLSLAMDLHDAWRGFSSPEAAVAGVEAEHLVIACREDSLVPADEQRAYHDRLLAAGKASTYREVSSPIGHDAFLVELAAMTALVRPFLLA